MLASLATTPSMRIAATQNAVLVHMFETIGMSEVAQVDRALTSVSAQFPQGVGIMLIKVDSGTPPNDVRVASAQMIQKHEGHLSGAAFVIEREGMLAAIGRTVANTAILASRSHHAKVFPSVPAGAQWLAERLARAPGVHVSAQELMEGARYLARGQMLAG